MLIDKIKTDALLLSALSDGSLSPAQKDVLWRQFFNLYFDAMCDFVEFNGGAAFADDVAQGVLIKLTEIFKENSYKREDNKSFHSYLKKLLKNALLDYARNAKKHEDKISSLGKEPLIYSDLAEEIANKIDQDWNLSIALQARRKVLKQNSIREMDKMFYIEFTDKGFTYNEIARRYHTSYDKVRRAIIKMTARICKMKEVLEKNEIRSAK